MKHYDVIVVGAGIHGAGVAQAVAAAGYSVIVLEKNTVGSGTSSKSSKLIHGGLRYLESYQFSLVRKSLKERAVLCRIAPDIVKLKSFYIPIYKQTSRRPWKIRLGLSLYALLGNLHRINLFKQIKRKHLEETDGLNKIELQTIYRYYDGQTNDKKLTEAVMRSAVELGAESTCSVEIHSIKKNKDLFKLSYQQKKSEKEISSDLIINATGPWVNEFHGLMNVKFDELDVDLVQGSHIILDATAPSGIYYLEAKDRRAVFVMPYEFEGELKTMVGTTESLYNGKADDVKVCNEEIEYLLTLYQSYFPNNKEAKVIKSFAGLRVLLENEGSMFSRSRETVLHWAIPGLLTIYGGKLTAYRSTSESVIKKIKPFLRKKRRVAYTDQLYLSLKDKILI